MTKYIITLIAAALCAGQPLLAWGKIGHNSIAHIAECHLTEKARANIERYLGHSIVYYATWMDEYRKTPEYKYTDKWHSGAVDKNLHSTKENRKEDGDCVTELENAIARLKDYKKLDDATVSLNLKFIIHLTGDMHCPVHILYPDIKMRFNVKLSGQQMSYHKLWDSGLLQAAHAWSYTEYRQQLDRFPAGERKAMSEGAPAGWMHESAVNCRVIYDWAKPNDELGQDFVNKAHALAEMQIVKAGYRLARVLNDLFDN